MINRVIFLLGFLIVAANAGLFDEIGKLFENDDKEKEKRKA